MMHESQVSVGTSSIHRVYASVYGPESNLDVFGCPRDGPVCARKADSRPVLSMGDLGEAEVEWSGITNLCLFLLRVGAWLIDIVAGRRRCETI